MGAPDLVVEILSVWGGRGSADDMAITIRFNAALELGRELRDGNRLGNES